MARARRRPADRRRSRRASAAQRSSGRSQWHPGKCARRAGRRSGVEGWIPRRPDRARPHPRRRSATIARELGVGARRGSAGRHRYATRKRLHQRPRPLRTCEPVASFAGRHAGIHVHRRRHGVRHPTPGAVMKFLTALFAGILFGAGLVISGMTDPANVLGFLDLFGEWRPQLAVVMAGAALAAAPAYLYVRRRHRSLLGEDVTLPDRTKIDAPLLTGAAIFGIGWGLAGICPGPGIALLASGRPMAWIFFAAVCPGLVLGPLLLRRPVPI